MYLIKCNSELIIYYVAVIQKMSDEIQLVLKNVMSEWYSIFWKLPFTQFPSKLGWYTYSSPNTQPYALLGTYIDWIAYK